MSSFDSTPKIALMIILLPLLFSLAAASSDTLSSGHPLTGDETLISSGGTFALGFFTPATDSNNRYVGIWYNNVTVQTIIWVANRDGPITGPANGTLSIAANGSLAIAGSNSTVLWSTPGVSGLVDPVAQLMDNGNFIVRESGYTSGNFSWQSFDHPTDTIIPGMKMGVDFTRRLNLTLTAWKSESDPSTGVYYHAINVSGDPEFYLREGAKKLWRSGSWDGTRFVGITENTTYGDKQLSFTFDVNRGSEITFTFHVTDPSILPRLVVNWTGVVEFSVWLAAVGEWSTLWYAPQDQCDDFNECGPNGVCDPNNSPICLCLPGFEPRFPANWELRDGSGGCVRKTPLDCRNRTDGFIVVVGAKLPETRYATVDMSLGLQECRALCLNNCSCTAYASKIAAGGGSGCIIWSTDLTDIRVFSDGGPDLYVRLAAADLDDQSHKSTHTVIAIIASVVAAIFLLAFSGYCLQRRRKNKRRRRRATISTNPFTLQYNDENNSGNDLELPLFPLETIAAATNNFSTDNKLGEGGFGPVYKGKINGVKEIAVKRLAVTSSQGVDEFKNEVMLIAKLQHRNLVRLLGCCIQGGERMLVYEYMVNTSLDAFLFDKERSELLSWETRYRIIEGIARGLVYLHQDSRFRIIHRDLKTSNILLDKDMVPKISDFGLARIFGGDETEANTKRVVGTYGYMSPEYAMDGIFSVKSDVYSFGVIVLEIVSGRRNKSVYLTSQHQNLIWDAWNLWNEGNGLQLVDETVGDAFSIVEVLKCVKIGLLCVQELPEDRPLMSSVVLMLGSENDPLPNPQRPAHFGRVALQMDSNINDSCFLNGLTITISQGR